MCYMDKKGDTGGQGYHVIWATRMARIDNLRKPYPYGADDNPQLTLFGGDGGVGTRLRTSSLRRVAGHPRQNLPAHGNHDQQPKVTHTFTSGMHAPVRTCSTAQFTFSSGYCAPVRSSCQAPVRCVAGSLDRIGSLQRL
jgi:hypothetical protein